MKAIIIPLNEFFYNFEKYDGLSASARFIKSVKWLDRFIDTKTGYIFLRTLVVFPIISILLVCYLGPIYIYHLILSGRKVADEEGHKLASKFEDFVQKMQRKDAKKFVEKFSDENYTLFVYYRDDMVPQKSTDRELFFQKIDSMKKNLQLGTVFKANRKEDVEDIMKLYNIDPSQSFFISNGEIELSNLPLLNKRGFETTLDEF